MVFFVLFLFVCLQALARIHLPTHPMEEYNDTRINGGSKTKKWFTVHGLNRHQTVENESEGLEKVGKSMQKAAQHGNGSTSVMVERLKKAHKMEQQKFKPIIH